MSSISEESSLFYTQIEKECEDIEKDLKKLKERLYSVGHKLDSFDIYFEDMKEISEEINEKLKKI